jgi:MYXO-CTERM domain-containing protein
MKTRIQTTIIKFAALSIGLCATATAATIFNFDADNQGTSTTFTDTVNGLSATFSSPSSPGSFSVQPSFFATLTGNVLGGPLFQSNVALDINFSANLSAIDLLFATADFNTPSPFTLAAYEGNTPVGSNTLPGMFLPGFTFPEGEIAFSGANFNSVVLSTTAPNFAIDNVQVAPGTAATPEPHSVWLAAAGLMALASSALRRRRS